MSQILNGQSDLGRAKIRLLRVCPPPPHLEEFRSSQALDSKSFETQISFLRKENLLLPGGWAEAMAQEGFEVFETICNDASLQESWARENGVAVDHAGTDFSLQVLIEQIRAMQPEIIFIYAGALVRLPRDVRNAMRAVCSGRVIVTGFWGDELPKSISNYEEFLGDLDLVFCANSSYEKTIRKAGISVFNLGNCFDDTITFERPVRKTHDFVFCGTSGYGYQDHIQRYEQLKQLMARTGLEIWANEPEISRFTLLFAKPIIGFLSCLPARILLFAEKAAMKLGISKLARAAQHGLRNKQSTGGMATMLGGLSHPKKNYFVGRKSLHTLYPNRVHGQMPKCGDYYSLLAKSNLVLNIHRDEEADFGNIRCFEATGLGTCLVTDRGAELAEFFDVENDIVTFETVEECVAKISRLLSQPSEIARIAANGQQATLSRHTVAHRCKVVAKKLRMSQVETSLR